ncbi:MAG: sporulation transcriptional regulator SpoIIID [Oscillospiraceae bacterium]|nr:sporulation transcriptional regulator SpoIIID [Oscillospiraceae bacterium]
MIETASRAETLGRYIVKNRSTVRAAAKAFGISKSTVHTDVTVKLKYLNGELWREVRQVLDENKAQRHIRGGQATREKYRKKKGAEK